MTEPATSTTERMHPRVCSRTAHPSDKNHWRWPWRKNFGQNDWWFRHQKPKKDAGHMASSHQEWATKTNKTDVQILIPMLMNVVMKCKTDSPKSSETQMAVWTHFTTFRPLSSTLTYLAQLKSLETRLDGLSTKQKQCLLSSARGQAIDHNGLHSWHQPVPPDNLPPKQFLGTWKWWTPSSIFFPIICVKGSAPSSSSIKQKVLLLLFLSQGNNGDSNHIKLVKDTIQIYIV